MKCHGDRVSCALFPRRSRASPAGLAPPADSGTSAAVPPNCCATNGFRELEVLYGIVLYCMVWYGMVWYGMVWYGLGRGGMGGIGLVGRGWDGMGWDGVGEMGQDRWDGMVSLPRPALLSTRQHPCN